MITEGLRGSNEIYRPKHRRFDLMGARLRPDKVGDAVSDAFSKVLQVTLAFWIVKISYRESADNRAIVLIA
jgi:hypothetical protein